MSEIKRLQDDLNSNPRLLREFLRDPTRMMAARRIRLSPTAQATLLKSLSDQQAVAAKVKADNVKWELKISGEHKV